jgi:hypothetical protein
LKICDLQFKIGDTIKYNKLEENRMKKLKLFTLVFIFLFILVGCKNAYSSLKLDNIKTSTILVKGNGEVQAAVVEKFNKSYYDKDDLKNYINTEIKLFNDFAGSNVVKLGKFQVKDNVSSLLITYKNMEQYAKFNHIDAQYMTVEEAESKSLLPFTFKNAKNNEDIGKDKVLEKEKYKVLILNEKYDVKVDGKIKYYSNAEPLNSEMVHTSGKKTSVIIFKP